MRINFSVRWLLSYLILITFMLTLLNTYGHDLMYNTLFNETKNAIYTEATCISDEYISQSSISDESFKSSIPTIRRQLIPIQKCTSMRIWLVNSSGRIITDSNNGACEGINIKKYSSSFLGMQFYTGKSLQKIISGDNIFVIYPLTLDLKTNGYIVISYPLATLHTKAISYTDNLIICFLAFSVILFLISLFLYLQMKLPLIRITNAAKEYAKGHFDYDIGKIPHDDYNDLFTSISYFKDKTAGMSEEQKKFIANVSHDFRSPLTSIKGYAQAFIDGTIPPELSDKYMNIILFETERLTKLTENLLELNNFEHNGISIKPSIFDINDIIRKTCDGFESRCISKKISIELIFSNKKLYVTADEGKIEQVIQNLTDNALKFSHQNSQIEISTAQSGNKVFVSVKDHGIGIPSESQSKIWDRFYKTDVSRGKDKTGSGLGLSITKEIIEAHNENINVISTPGAGTEFIFSLPHTSVN